MCSARNASRLPPYPHGRVWSPGPARDACAFEFDGDAAATVIRRAKDPLTSLDAAHNKMEAGNPVNLWGTVERPEWVQKYAIASDGTIGPALLPHTKPEAAGLCLGIKREGAETKVVLVHRSDLAHRLVVGSADEMAGYLSELASDRADQRVSRHPF